MTFRVFYELTHTSCDREIMRSPDIAWDIYHPGGWDERDRPFPENARLVPQPEGKYDAAVVGTEHRIQFVPHDVPIAFVCRTDFGSWPKPLHLLPRIAAWVAPCQETVDRWNMSGEPKAKVIEHGIDMDVFHGYVGDLSNVITVGNLLPIRPEKGPDVLQAVAKRIPVDVYGFGNEPLPNAHSYAGMKALADVYRRSAIYFNPSTVTVCAVLEAMATGMPVVTMAPIGNYQELMQHRQNCLIASSPDDACQWIELLLKNPGLRKDLGVKARASVEHRFHPALSASRWRTLLRSIAGL